MNKLLPLLLLGMLLSISACEKKEERILPKVATTTQNNVADKARIEREAFISKAQNEFDELGVKLAEIRKKAVDASGNAREKLNRQVFALEQEQKSVEEKLANMKSAIGESWKGFKDGVTASIEQFKQSVKSAM